MKKHIYNCNSGAVTAQAAIREHLSLYPNGLATTNGRSRRCVYGQLGYVIYETKTTIVVDRLGG